MTATSDFMNANTATDDPGKMLDGGRLVVRAMMRLMGVALTLAAIGIWLAPGATWETDVLMFKLVLSVSAVLAGLGLMQASGAKSEAPEVKVDLIRREVRLLHPGQSGTAAILKRCSFSDLTRAEVRGSHVRLFGPDSNMLTELTLKNRKALGSLIAGLKDAGKLA